MIGNPKSCVKQSGKNEKVCSDNQHIFISFAFDTYSFLGLEVVDLLRRVQRMMHSNVMYLSP